MHGVFFHHTVTSCNYKQRNAVVGVQFVDWVLFFSRVKPYMCVGARALGFVNVVCRHKTQINLDRRCSCL